MDPKIVETATCLYTVAPDDEFQLGWIDPTTFVVSPCSGHGFKFAPWIGELVADVIEEKRQWERLRS